MEALTTKKRTLVVVGIIFIALTISVWIGGRKKWEMLTIGPETVGSASVSTAYEEELKRSPEDSVLKYNLAFLYYRQNRFKDAEELLTKALDAPDTDKDVVQKRLYNLGNVLFRQSEKETTAEGALSLLKRSLRQYRSVLEGDYEREFYTAQAPESDDDARFNYALVKQRIKILADQIEKQRKDQQRKKELFVLLRELLEREMQIKSQLESMPTMENEDQRREMRNLLLKKQTETLERLNTVKEKIRDDMLPGKPRTTAAPTV